MITPLIDGYKKFRAEYFEETNTFHTLVAHGQKPKAMIVACCDSRVDPAIVTGCKPGELFVVRSIANLVPPFADDPLHHGTSAALEYGVRHLAVNDIIIFGHSHCGGIAALMEQSPAKTNFISSWMDIASMAKQKVLMQYPECSHAEQAHYCEKESLLISLNNLTTFPWIKQSVLANKLSLHAWYFNLSTGVIETYKKDLGQFISLD